MASNNNNTNNRLMVLPAAARSLKTINEIFQSTSPRCAMTINPSRGGDGKFALAKGAQRGLYSRPIPHRPRIEITFFFCFFLSFSKHFAHAKNQTSRHAGRFTSRPCILENILQIKFCWKIIWED